MQSIANKPPSKPPIYQTVQLTCITLFDTMLIVRFSIESGQAQSTTQSTTMKKILTPNKVRAMRRLYWVKGLTSMCIARLYGVKNQTVYDAVTYRTWGTLQDNFSSSEITRHDNSL